LVAGVCLFAFVMAVAIAWRVSDRDGAPQPLSILTWQLVVWLPWVAYFYAIHYVARWVETSEHSMPLRWLTHSTAALAIATSHLLWFWQISSRISPLLGLPGTRYGAYAFFFVFWFLIDLILYFTILILWQSRPSQRQQSDSSPYTERFSVRKGRTQYVIPTSDIRWIEAQSYYAALHTDSGCYLIRRSLTKLENDLNPEHFIRVHRSTILNTRCIKGIQTDADGSCSVILVDGERHKVSRSRRQDVKSALGAL